MHKQMLGASNNPDDGASGKLTAVSVRGLMNYLKSKKAAGDQTISPYSDSSICLLFKSLLGPGSDN